jgi:hypothetical protein
MNYYYLVASLPMLSLGREAPLDSVAFRALCAEHLTPRDLAVFDDLVGTGGTTTDDAFVVAWRERETRLRNAIVQARAARRGLDPAAYLRPETGFDTYALKAVEDAFARTSPADRELDLDRFRWRVLEELAGMNAFTLAAVLAYALKLRLVERWSRLDATEGIRRVDEFVSRASRLQSGAVGG